MKEVLRQLVAEVEDLRACLDALLDNKLTMGGVQDAKNQAIAANKPAFDSLRAKIDAL